MKRVTIALGVLIAYLILCLFYPSIFNKPIDPNCTGLKTAVAVWTGFGVLAFLGLLFESVRTHVNLRNGDAYRGNSRCLKRCLDQSKLREFLFFSILGAITIWFYVLIWCPFTIDYACVTGFNIIYYIDVLILLVLSLPVAILIVIGLGGIIEGCLQCCCCRRNPQNVSQDV